MHIYYSSQRYRKLGELDRIQGGPNITLSCENFNKIWKTLLAYVKCKMLLLNRRFFSACKWFIEIYEKWAEGGTSGQDCHATQGIVIIKCNASRSGTLRNCNLKSLDDDVMRIDEAMMRAADINMRADDGWHDDSSLSPENTLSLLAPIHMKNCDQILSWTIMETDAQLTILIRFLRYLAEMILFYVCTMWNLIIFLSLKFRKLFLNSWPFFARLPAQP